MRKLLGCVLSALVMGWMLVSPVSGQLGTGQSSPVFQAVDNIRLEIVRR